VSELFDVVWYACVIVCLSSGKCFAYALDIHAALEDMGKSRTHGGYGGQGSEWSAEDWTGLASQVESQV